MDRTTYPGDLGRQPGLLEWPGPGYGSSRNEIFFPLLDILTSLYPGPLSHLSNEQFKVKQQQTQITNDVYFLSISYHSTIALYPK